MDSVKYLRFEDKENLLGSEVTYFETKNGWPLRQITVIGEKDYIMSSAVHPEHGLVLSDKSVDSTIRHVTQIKQEEFENVWNKYLINDSRKWDMSKASNPIESDVAGVIRVFYPQGVIVDLENDVIGIANFKECLDSSGPEFMYPRHKVSAKVTGYDETNHWIILGSPVVHHKHPKNDWNEWFKRKSLSDAGD